MNLKLKNAGYMSAAKQSSMQDSVILVIQKCKLIFNLLCILKPNILEFYSVKKENIFYKNVLEVQIQPESRE